MFFAEMMDAVRSLPRREKLRLLQQLVGELANEEGLTDSTEHSVWSPYDAFEAARTLQEVLDAERDGTSK